MHLFLPLRFAARWLFSVGAKPFLDVHRRRSSWEELSAFERVSRASHHFERLIGELNVLPGDCSGVVCRGGDFNWG